jgi:hypothetical protein
MLPRSIVLVFLLALACGLAGFFSASAAGIDYIGLRVALPLGNVPFLIGVELGSRLPFGWGVTSLFLSPDGRTLILGSIEVALSERTNLSTSLIRATAGISYFDLSATFPSPVFGGGIAYRISSEAGFQIGIGGEILYPLALRPPFLSVGGGWSPR